MQQILLLIFFTRFQALMIEAEQSVNIGWWILCPDASALSPRIATDIEPFRFDELI